MVVSHVWEPSQFLSLALTHIRKLCKFFFCSVCLSFWFPFRSVCSHFGSLSSHFHARILCRWGCISLFENVYGHILYVVRFYFICMRCTEIHARFAIKIRFNVVHVATHTHTHTRQYGEGPTWLEGLHTWTQTAPIIQWRPRFMLLFCGQRSCSFSNHNFKMCTSFSREFILILRQTSLPPRKDTHILHANLFEMFMLVCKTDGLFEISPIELFISPILTVWWSIQRKNERILG